MDCQRSRSKLNQWDGVRWRSVIHDTRLVELAGLSVFAGSEKIGKLALFGSRFLEPTIGRSPLLHDQPKLCVLSLCIQDKASVIMLHRASWPPEASVVLIRRGFGLHPNRVMPQLLNHDWSIHQQETPMSSW